MADIIKFPNPDEVVEQVEDKGEVMARITVYENGTVGCWVSNDVDSDESKTWLKACLLDGVFGIHTVLYDGEELEPIVEKEFNDDDN